MATYRRSRKGGKPKGVPGYKPAKPLDEQCKDEIDALEKDFLDANSEGFRKRLAREKKRKEGATESEFWFCVYGATRLEKLAFLKKWGLDHLDSKYISLRDFERALDRVLARKTGSARDGHRR